MLGVRVTPAMKAAVIKAAAKEHSTISDWICRAIDTALGSKRPK